jgi:hypothetical protein
MHVSTVVYDAVDLATTEVNNGEFGLLEKRKVADNLVRRYGSDMYILCGDKTLR